MVFKSRGISAFYAHESIAPGDDWNDKLRQALIDCEEVVLLCSPDAADSAWVLLEIGAAWVLKKRITPILLAGSIEDLPDPIRRIQFATIRSVGGLEGLINQICNRHKQQPVPSNALPIVSQDADSYPRNDSPPITIHPFQLDWVRCPCCKKAFCLRSSSSWNGERHMTCGQQLIIADRTSDAAPT
jgi:hypothetical protein